MPSSECDRCKMAQRKRCLCEREEMLRADRAEDSLREREKQLARVLEAADSWEEAWGDGPIKANVAANAIRRAVRGVGREH